MTSQEAVDPKWRRQLAECGLERLTPLLDCDEVGHLPGKWEQLGKPGLGGRRRWRWTLDDLPDQPVFYVKRYADASPREQWDRATRQTLRHGRAWWEYTQARRLTDAHINVPVAVGFAERMRGVLEDRGLVILREVPGDGFDRTWRRLREQNAPVTRGLARHDIAVRLARFVAAFHGTGCCHRDLYLCHIFVDLAGPDQPPVFTLIDLARTFRLRGRRMRWIIKDLSQLDASAREIGASRTDRWRFLLAYLNLQPRASRARWYARRIVRKSNWILRRIARKSAAK